MTNQSNSVPAENIESLIRTIRGQKVILDNDLSRVFGVPAKRLNAQVKHNRERFPADFMFQLTATEHDVLRSQNATLKPGRGRHRKLARIRGISVRSFRYSTHPSALDLGTLDFRNQPG